MKPTIHFGETKEITFKAGTDTYTRKAKVFDFQYFDENEQVIKIVSEDGTLNNYEYHINGQMKIYEMFQHEKLIFKHEFDEEGNLIKPANAEGKASVVTKEYDSHGRLILVKNDENERMKAYDSKGRKVFDGTNQGDANYFVYSDDEKFKLIRYLCPEDFFELIMEDVIENGKKVMCITYKVIH